jgi:hypothetical protein
MRRPFDPFYWGILCLKDALSLLLLYLAKRTEDALNHIFREDKDGPSDVTDYTDGRDEDAPRH